MVDVIVAFGEPKSWERLIKIWVMDFEMTAFIPGLYFLTASTALAVQLILNTISDFHLSIAQPVSHIQPSESGTSHCCLARRHKIYSEARRYMSLRACVSNVSIAIVVQPFQEDIERQPWKYTGYKNFAPWVAFSNKFFHVRKFETLNDRVILALQDQISEFEA